MSPTETYQRHVKSFTDAYQPQGPTESHLVQALADAAWRITRATAFETSLSLATEAKILPLLSLHTDRLSRQFERTLALLNKLQDERQTREKLDLDDILEVIDMYQAKGETYRPADDGFVFSKTQIQKAREARDRAWLIAEAYEANEK